MKATELITAVKKINGHGDEIIQVFDKETGKHKFSTKTSASDKEIRENAMFELDYDSKELRSEIAELIISMK